MAKRVNTRFLIILTVVLGGLVALFVGGMALKHFVFKPNVKQELLAGDNATAAAAAAPTRAAREQAYKDARDAYGRALRRDSGNISALIKLGDTWAQLQRYDLDAFRQDARVWEIALTASPTNTQVLNRLLNRALDVVDLEPHPQGFADVSKYAKQLYAADPSDLRARALRSVGLIGTWLRSQPVAVDEVKAAVKELEDLIPKVPTEARLPYYLSAACLKFAHDDAARNDNASATQWRDKATAVFEEAVKQEEARTAAFYFRYYQILSSTADPDGDGEIAPARLARMKQVIEAAEALVKPADREFADIKVQHAGFLGQTGQNAAVLSTIEDAARAKPDDELLRMTLAKVYRTDPARRAKAIEILREEPHDDVTINGVRAWAVKRRDVQRLVDLASLLLDAFPSTAEATREQRDAARAEIEDLYRKVVGLRNDTEAPEVLKLRGRIALLDNNSRAREEAAALLQRAFDKRLQQDGTVEGELVMLLADLYARTGQNGSARAVLSKMVDKRKVNAPARKMLAELLIRDKEFDKAREHVAALKLAFPTDPDVARLEVTLLSGEGKTDDALKAALAMSEDDDVMRLRKAQTLVVLGESDKSRALLTPLAENEIKAAHGFDAVRLLAVSLKTGKPPLTDAAFALVDRAAAAAPADKQFDVFRKIIKGGTPEEIQRALSDSSDDPVVKVIQNYRVLLQQKKPAEALALLQSADKTVAGNDGRIAERIFDHALDTRQWDILDAAAKRLADLDWDRAGGAYYRARRAVARNDSQTALKEAREYAARPEAPPRAFVLLGQANLMAGRADEAMSAYKQATDRQPGNLEALRGLTECYLQAKLYEEARRSIIRGLAAAPTSPYFKDKARSLVEIVGDPATVTDEREADVKAPDASVLSYVALSDNYLRCAEVILSKRRRDKPAADQYLEKAATNLRAAIAKFPDEPSPYARMADVFFKQGKADEGQRFLEQMRDDPKWKDRVEPYLFLAGFQQRRGNMQWVEVNLRDAIARAQGPLKYAIRQQLVAYYLTQKEPERQEKGITELTDLADTTKDPNLQKQLIESLVNLGQFDRAQARLDDSLAKSPNDVRLLTLKAFVRMSQKKQDEALALLEQAIKLDPSFPPALLYRGMIRIARGDLVGGTADLMIARDGNPGSVETHIQLSEAMRRKGQLDEAAKELEIASQLDPSRKDLLVRIIDLRAATKQWTQVDDLLDACDKNPDLAGDSTWKRVRARLWVQRGDNDRALEAMQAAVDMEREAEQLKPDTLFEYFDLLAKAKDGPQKLLQVTDTLLAQFAEAKSQAPWWMYMVRGESFAKLSKKKEAAEEFSKALIGADLQNEDPASDALGVRMTQSLGVDAVISELQARKQVRWEIVLAQAYATKGDMASAVTTIDGLLGPKFADLNPSQQLKALRLAGPVYQSAGDKVPGSLEKAEKAYVKYVGELDRLGPRANAAQMEALNNLACLLAEQKGAQSDPALALPHAKKAYQLMEATGASEPSILDTYGWVLVLTGKLDEGITILQAAVGKERTPPDAYFHLGESLRRKNMFDEARANLEEARTRVKEATEKGIMIDPTLAAKIEASLEKLTKATKTASGNP